MSALIFVLLQILSCMSNKKSGFQRRSRGHVERFIRKFYRVTFPDPVHLQNFVQSDPVFEDINKTTSKEIVTILT